MKRLPVLVLLAALLTLPPATAQPAAGTLPARWQTGAADCTAATPPLQVHEYRPGTYVLRQSLCADFEGPFMYLLIGNRQALLIDTGAVADAQSMPLAKTVLGLLPDDAHGKRPLLVVHTHGHADHRAGDAQFAGLPATRIAPTDLAGVRRFFGLPGWPDARASVDLGGRKIEVIPTPGHHDAHLAYYDPSTGLLFSGDFLLPGRLLIEDTATYADSARRVATLLRDRPVTHVLGGHIELDAAGQAYPHGAQHHPDERRLQLDKRDLLGLPAALAAFNGFYARQPNYLLSHPLHNLLALAAGALAALLLVAWALRRWWRRRSAHRAGA
ncbi:MBL fold metallo-hydrolase [Lysobacter cavernae]|uniref:MBL fold metallo-hydrolase n=1 Tax=Lysobacter cavernae TaxID=1685901 RepID=A0ABV7RSV7_9GAMM